MSDLVRVALDEKRLNERLSALYLQRDEQQARLARLQDAADEALADGREDTAAHARNAAQQAQVDYHGTLRAIELIRQRLREAKRELRAVQSQQEDAAAQVRDVNARCEQTVETFADALHAFLHEHSPAAIIGLVQEAARAESLEHALRTGRRRYSDPQALQAVVRRGLNLVLEPLATYERMMRSNGEA